MAIQFSTLRFKNFLSSGNAFTEICFNEHPTTLVVGKNGSGKSTMLDALCFVLFGKPFRNINKPQLVNSVNLKNCVVEIEFAVGKRAYKIVRGIKPNLFEIYQDGVLIDQDAASRDYQKHLEENILKLNFKSFTQIVILGMASFTPFMELPAATRREIIEDILDIRIFTVMNELLKGKVSALKDELNTVENDLKINMEKTRLQDTFVKSLQADKQQRIDELTQKIAENQHDITEKTAKIETLTADRDGLLHLLGDTRPVRLEVSELTQQLRDLEKDKAELTKRSATQPPESCTVCAANPEIQAFNFRIRDLQKEEAEWRKKASVDGDFTTCPICSVHPNMLELNNKIRDAERDIASIAKNADFYKDHTSCPTCKQDISEELRQEHIDAVESQVGRLKGTITMHQTEKVNFGTVAHNAHIAEANTHLQNVVWKLDTAVSDHADLLLELHTEHVTDAMEKLTAIGTAIIDAKVALDAINSKVAEIEIEERKIASLNADILTVKSEVSGVQRFLDSLEKEKNSLSQKSDNIEQEKAKLREMAKEVLTMTERKATLKEEKDYHDVATALLKDGGVKTRIIKQYLPAINKMVNKYLHAMDFFASFELNEQFNETIKSRHRDEFSYESFSEGEKQRIDLALVFTWRTIAKMKNSTSTNLLILDEVFDSSLDSDGTDYVVNLLKAIGEQTNVWVISHKPDAMADKFSNVLQFVKKNNYSVLETKHV